MVGDPDLRYVPTASLRLAAHRRGGAIVEGRDFNRWGREPFGIADPGAAIEDAKIMK